MRICIYEDSAATRLEPIALTRPAFGLWCGAERLHERLIRHFGGRDVGYWMRPALAPLWQLEHPGDPVNDDAWAGLRPTVWINGRWLPDADAVIDTGTPHVGVVNRQIAYIVPFSIETPGGDDVDMWLDEWKARLPERPVGGAMIDYLWDAVDRNPEMLTRDSQTFRAAHGLRPLPPHVAVTGPVEQFLVADGATIDPFVFVDTRGGPVLIDRGAFVNSFSRLEGPCYVGRDSWIVGAKLRAGCTIGPNCRIGGEVEASIVQGFTNKYHDGFLGHSYIGEWVNLAAATQTSDLRNDYDVVRVNIDGQRVVTGRTKIGAYIGDHAKTGLGALLNTGSTVGPFANVLPTGTLLPQVIPAFCRTNRGEFQEITDLRKAFTSAGRVMQRRGGALTDVHREFYYSLFEATAERRRETILEDEMRRLKRSV